MSVDLEKFHLPYLSDKLLKSTRSRVQCESYVRGLHGALHIMKLKLEI